MKLIKRSKEVDVIYKELIKMLGDDFDPLRDSLNITILAEHINTINECNDTIAEIGTIYVADSGYRQLYPEVTLREKAQKGILTLSERYGLSIKDNQKLSKDDGYNIELDDIGDFL